MSRILLENRDKSRQSPPGDPSFTSNHEGFEEYQTNYVDHCQYYSPKKDRSCLFSFFLNNEANELSAGKQYEAVEKKTMIGTKKTPATLSISLPSMKEKRGTCGIFSWSALPIVLSITSSIGFIITYMVAKRNCHIEKWIFPFLSYTGTEHPESMIFGLILNTEGFLGLIVVFLAWRYYRHMGERGCLNTIGLICGSFSCFGVILVGNFQVTQGKIPHYIGAGLAFIVGTCYGILTSILSRRVVYRIQPPLKLGHCVSVVRWASALIMILSLISLSGVGLYKNARKDNRTKEVDHNTTDLLLNGGCKELLSKVPLHVQYIDLLGSVTEWLLTACMLLCLCLFAYEFKTFQNVKVVLLTPSGLLYCNNRDCEVYSRSISRTTTLLNNSPSAPKKQYLNQSGISKQLSLDHSSSAQQPPRITSYFPDTQDDAKTKPLFVECQTHFGMTDSGVRVDFSSVEVQLLSTDSTASETNVSNRVLSKSLPNIFRH